LPEAYPSCCVDDNLAIDEVVEVDVEDPCKVGEYGMPVEWCATVSDLAELVGGSPDGAGKDLLRQLRR
jgi:hypothetical protein